MESQAMVPFIIGHAIERLRKRVRKDGMSMRPKKRDSNAQKQGCGRVRVRVRVRVRASSVRVRIVVRARVRVSVCMRMDAMHHAHMQRLRAPGRRWAAWWTPHRHVQAPHGVQTASRAAPSSVGAIPHGESTFPPSRRSKTRCVPARRCTRVSTCNRIEWLAECVANG